NALVFGPLKVIPQEYPYIICRSIDIEPPPPGTPQEEILLTHLSDELSMDSGSQETDIAYRGHYRWIKNYDSIRVENPVEETLPLKNQGVYLITGGIGDIGVTLAQYLVEQFHARLILTGISPLPPGAEWDRWLKTHNAEDKTSLKIMKIRRLEAAGGKILFFAADVGDKKTMSEVIRRGEETFGPINGVIHAAGVTKDKSVLCSVAEIGENEWNRQFRPKIQGTSVLAELFQNKPLDFCVLISSLSPILGGLGFAAYSAANAFMDAFVYHAGRSDSLHQIRWLSVNWADWGFKKEFDMELQQAVGAPAGDLVITPQEGVETFKRVLELLPALVRQVAISSGDLQTRINQWVKLRSLRKSDSPASSAVSPVHFHERPQLTTAYAAPRSPVEQAIAGVWRNQFGIDKIGIHDDFFQLGGDSLKAISMISKIHKELKARVQLNDFFSRPTIETLAQFITGTQKSGYSSIQPAEKKEYYPLSPAQKRLYLLDQIGNPGIAYNLTLVVELTGKLTKERLEQAFNASVKRHETFRTSFIIVDDKPVQRIHNHVPFEIEYYNLATEDTEDTEKKREGFIHSFVRPFDLAKAPLMRVGLLMEKAGKHLLIVDIHHIISDGVSHLILVKEFIDLYENNVLPALHLQYKDYSEWCDSPMRREAVTKQAGYWLHEMGNEMPVPDLPADYTRPKVQSFAGGAVMEELNEEETKALNEIVRTGGATLFMGLLAAYTIFLARISNGEDIPIGCPVAGRGHADLEHILGMFVNTLVLRNSPHPGKTFRCFLQEVKQKTLAAFENQDYPFEELVEKVAKGRDTDRNPLFDV
ncbi:MAG TPA: SDR family NAD(P)-dependent oxidoreductase, partial [Candidatus Deferrimicrobium sp.]|nr:SDR family NAD(P)-dependent oxidoreductase [Candidatus Deferrimicrobium sp.]